MRSFCLLPRLLAAALLGLLVVSGKKSDFRCPEEFGYYSHPTDCNLYYVCVFGGPLLESCTGGLVYSHDLQTCDWPRNVACNSNRNSILDETLNIAVALDSQKDDKSKSNRTPRKQNNSKNNNNNILALPKQTSRDGTIAEELEEEILSLTPMNRKNAIYRKKQRDDVFDDDEEEEEEEELLALSPQPSIVSTVTHGATNNLQKSKDQEEKIDRISTIDILEDLQPALQFGDVLFGQRTSGSSKISNSNNNQEVNNTHIQQSLLAHYPGESKVLDDSQDLDPLDIFYYTNWEDPIYDQFEEVEYDDKQDIIDKIKGSVWIDDKTPQRPSRTDDQGPRAEDPVTHCTKAKCKLPDCRCGSAEIPGNLSVRNTPQLVVLTFDDSVNDLNKQLYQDIFHTSRKNPNGCPIAATFYVSHEWTDYGLVQSLYSDGHEIASHSISHSFGEQFSKTKWLKEMAGQREILAGFAGIKLEDVRGIRAPFLAIGGNNMFSMLYDANFTYDSSMPIYDNRPPTFPYTMDYKLTHDCMIPPCPNRAFPGVWEIPLVMWNDLKDGRCSMADACSNPPNAEGVYYMIMKNFQRHYNTNRSPFGLSYHPAWFTTPHHKEGFELFLDTILAMEDVWVVTAWQTIQWMRDPTPIQNINQFKPFKCEYKERPPRCDKPKVCNLWHKSGVRYMRTCQECPDLYPWTGRTGIANSLVDPL